MTISTDAEKALDKYNKTLLTQASLDQSKIIHGISFFLVPIFLMQSVIFKQMK